MFPRVWCLQTFQHKGLVYKNLNVQTAKNIVPMRFHPHCPTQNRTTKKTEGAVSGLRFSAGKICLDHIRWR